MLADCQTRVILPSMHAHLRQSPLRGKIGCALGETMAGGTDFIALYHEICLDPDCTPEALKQAYRKRVGTLHPDRQDGRAPPAATLQRLNTQYAAAIEFHRRHGRLPGATQQSGAELPAQLATGASDSAPGRNDTTRVRSRSRFPMTILLVVILGLWAFAQFVPKEADPPGKPEPLEAASRTMLAAGPDLARVIGLGTSAQQVREIHGAPVSGWEKRWEYGPSWIAFQCGVVVDWYSSPLRPLKVETEHPVASAQWSPPKHCKE